MRLDRLTEIYNPKKTTNATVEYVDYIGLTKGDMVQNRKVFDLIKDADAIVHVVRGFEDESITHPMENINPRRDAETVELEMIFGDLELVDKKARKDGTGLKKEAKSLMRQKRKSLLNAKRVSRKRLL